MNETVESLLEQLESSLPESSVDVAEFEHFKDIDDLISSINRLGLPSSLPSDFTQKLKQAFDNEYVKITPELQNEVSQFLNDSINNRYTNDFDRSYTQRTARRFHDLSDSGLLKAIRKVDLRDNLDEFFVESDLTDPTNISSPNLQQILNVRGDFRPMHDAIQQRNRTAREMLESRLDSDTGIHTEGKLKHSPESVFRELLEANPERAVDLSSVYNDYYSGVPVPDLNSIGLNVPNRTARSLSNIPAYIQANNIRITEDIVRELEDLVRNTEDPTTPISRRLTSAENATGDFLYTNPHRFINDLRRIVPNFDSINLENYPNLNRIRPTIKKTENEISSVATPRISPDERRRRSLGNDLMNTIERTSADTDEENRVRDAIADINNQPDDVVVQTPLDKKYIINSRETKPTDILEPRSFSLREYLNSIFNTENIDPSSMHIGFMEGDKVNVSKLIESLKKEAPIKKDIYMDHALYKKYNHLLPNVNEGLETPIKNTKAPLKIYTNTSKDRILTKADNYYDKKNHPLLEKLSGLDLKDVSKDLTPEELLDLQLQGLEMSGIPLDPEKLKKLKRETINNREIKDREPYPFINQKNEILIPEKDFDTNSGFIQKLKQDDENLITANKFLRDDLGAVEPKNIGLLRYNDRGHVGYRSSSKLGSREGVSNRLLLDGLRDLKKPIYSPFLTPDGRASLVHEAANLVDTIKKDKSNYLDTLKNYLKTGKLGKLWGMVPGAIGAGTAAKVGAGLLAGGASLAAEAASEGLDAEDAGHSDPTQLGYHIERGSDPKQAEQAVSIEKLKQQYEKEDEEKRKLANQYAADKWNTKAILQSIPKKLGQ